jgi:hypothetical protein
MKVDNHNSYYIKNELMYYWRCIRQLICADEVSYCQYIADVLVVKKEGYIHEIEVKTTKLDLCTAEFRKNKHNEWLEKYPHYFSFAVPSDLIEEAKKIIEKVNHKYGLIEITDNFYYPIVIKKSALRLHDNLKYSNKWKEDITKRLCNAIIFERRYKYEKLLHEEYNI